MKGSERVAAKSNGKTGPGSLTSCTWDNDPTAETACSAASCCHDLSYRDLGQYNPFSWCLLYQPGLLSCYGFGSSYCCLFARAFANTFPGTGYFCRKCYVSPVVACGLEYGKVALSPAVGQSSGDGSRIYGPFLFFEAAC
jgi:hypothetical protein